MLDVNNIIEDVLTNNSVEIIDIFECGKNKIEFMGKMDDKIISISVVDNLSYDFTVFNYSGDKIVYNNTQTLKSLSKLKALVQQDMKNIMS